MFGTQWFGMVLLTTGVVILFLDLILTSETCSHMMHDGIWLAGRQDPGILFLTQLRAFCFKYLFIWWCPGLTRRGGSSCAMWELPLRQTDSSCGTRAPEHVDLWLWVHQPSCSAACGILLPQPGVEPTSLALQGSLNHQTTRKSLAVGF